MWASDVCILANAAQSVEHLSSLSLSLSPPHTLNLDLSFSIKQPFSPALKLSQCKGLAHQTPSELHVFRLALIHLRPPTSLSPSLHPPSLHHVPPPPTTHTLADSYTHGSPCKQDVTLSLAQERTQIRRD